MTVLGLLQNMWVRDPDRVLAALKRQPTAELRTRMWRIMIRMWMPATVTGRRLRKAFGERLFERIVWDNATPVIAGRSDGAPGPDGEWVASVIADVQPDLVLTFGLAAHDAVLQAGWEGGWIKGPHPAWRSKTVQPELESMARRLREVLEAAAQ